MIDYRVYLITDDPSRYKENWLDNVVAAVEGGVTCVQYRDTENPRERQYARIRELQDALKRFPEVGLVVNNDAELAAAVKAEGVHVGQNDMPVAEVRKIVGPECEIGLSITEISQLSPITPRPSPLTPHPTCLGIGPVFDARKTKADASAAMGVAGLKEIIERLHSSFASGSSFSTVAIGGITLENGAEVLATGVGGLAVVSAFSKSANPDGIAAKFRKLFHE